MGNKFTFRPIATFVFIYLFFYETCGRKLDENNRTNFILFGLEFSSKNIRDYFWLDSFQINELFFGWIPLYFRKPGFFFGWTSFFSKHRH